MDKIYKNYYINLPVIESGSNNFIGDVVSNDIYSNKFNVDLYQGKKRISLIGALYATITINKPDDTEIIDNCKFEDAERGTLSYVLPQGAVSMDGIHFVSIELYSGGDRITSAYMTYNVKEELSNQEGITSKDEYPILTYLIDDISNRWEKIIAADQQDGEVIDARYSTIKDHSYYTLNDRLHDAEIKVSVLPPVNPIKNAIWFEETGYSEIDFDENNMLKTDGEAW